MKMLIAAVAVSAVLGGWGGWSFYESLKNKEDAVFVGQYEKTDSFVAELTEEFDIKTDTKTGYLSELTKVTVINKKDKAVVLDIVVNDGNCAMKSPSANRPATSPMGVLVSAGLPALDFPVTLNKGEHVDAYFAECYVVQVDVFTNNGKYTHEF